MSEQLEMWKKDDADISLSEMDAAVEVLRELDNEKKAKKKVADEASAEYTKQAQKVMKMMEESGKDTYIVSGVGRVTVSEQLSVQTPKSPQEKQAFFDWVRENMGEDSYYHYMSVNSRSLNSLYKEKVEEYGSEGKVLEIDGISAPTSFAKLSFKKA